MRDTSNATSPLDPGSQTLLTARESDHESVFRSFRRWPLVPSPELQRLRSVLLKCDAVMGPDSVHELSDSARKLLELVTEELERREASGGPVFRTNAPEPEATVKGETPVQRLMKGRKAPWPGISSS